ncbi:MAG: type II toxin-antitoxin system VapC family toxin [Bryobacteraceae bacterium]|jgi:PIN domain nuclease of toxin-antitoxin system
MKLLLDTCAFLWLNGDFENLPLRVRQICADTENELYLSVLSAWEIALKQGVRRLTLPEPADQYVPSRRKANGIASLKLTEEAVLQVRKLPPVHNDPFDRMLICQAIVHGLTILTPDKQIARYPVPVVW